MKHKSQRTAERWQHIAWGEPTSVSEAGVTPGYMLSLLRSWPMLMTQRAGRAHWQVESR